MRARGERRVKALLLYVAIWLLLIAYERAQAGGRRHIINTRYNMRMPLAAEDHHRRHRHFTPTNISAFHLPRHYLHTFIIPPTHRIHRHHSAHSPPIAFTRPPPYKKPSLSQALVTSQIAAMPRHRRAAYGWFTLLYYAATCQDAYASIICCYAARHAGYAPATRDALFRCARARRVMRVRRSYATSHARGRRRRVARGAPPTQFAR